MADPQSSPWCFEDLMLWESGCWNPSNDCPLPTLWRKSYWEDLTNKQCIHGYIYIYTYKYIHNVYSYQHVLCFLQKSHKSFHCANPIYTGTPHEETDLKTSCRIPHVTMLEHVMIWTFCVCRFLFSIIVGCIPIVNSLTIIMYWVYHTYINSNIYIYIS